MTQDLTTPQRTEKEELLRLQSLNTWGVVSYVLHLIVALSAMVPGGQFGTVLLMAALVIDLIKREDAAGTWHASHFRWRIRTVLIAGLLYCVTAPLWLLFFFPGWIAWTVISIWFLYRIATGFMALNKGQPMELSA
jgi:uncharacterized membrane protein